MCIGKMTSERSLTQTKRVRKQPRVSPVPVLEEAPEAEGHELQGGLDHKGGGEDVVAVLERRLQRLRQE